MKKIFKIIELILLFPFAVTFFILINSYMEYSKFFNKKTNNNH